MNLRCGTAQGRPLSVTSLVEALSHDRVMRLTVVVVVLSVIPFLVPVSEDFLAYFATRGQLVMMLGVVVLALRSQLDRAPSGVERRFWGDLGFAYGAWLVVAILLLFYPTVEKPLLPRLAADIGYSLYYGALLVSTERRPELGPRARHDDAGIRSAALLLVLGLLVYLVVLPWLYSAWSYHSIFLDTSLFLAFDLLIALRFGLRSFLVAGRRWKIFYGGLAFAAGVTFAADLLEITVYQRGWSYLWSSPLSLIWIVPLLAVVATARLRHVPELASQSDAIANPLNGADIAWRTVLSGFALPLIHFAARPLDLHDATLEPIREQLIFVWLLLVGGLALSQSYRHHRRLEGLQRDHRALGEELEKKEQERGERQQLLAELECRNAELERFVYTVSHDLKGPLFTIHGFAATLGLDLAAGRTGRARDDLRRIRRGVASMRQLLDDLLQLSRVGRVVSPSQAIDLADLLREAAERAFAPDTAPLGAAAQADEASPPPSPIPDLGLAEELPTIWGDRDRLLEVFVNLLSNAARYGREEEQPRIEVGATEEGAWVHCSVTDNGRGIAAKDLERVFDLFVRLESGIAGTGIGLTLAKRIVELHGGSIRLESEGLGQGTTVWLTLPRPPDRGES